MRIGCKTAINNQLTRNGLRGGKTGGKFPKGRENFKLLEKAAGGGEGKKDCHSEEEHSKGKLSSRCSGCAPGSVALIRLKSSSSGKGERLMGCRTEGVNSP